jgi:hypothetical protein
MGFLACYFMKKSNKNFEQQLMDVSMEIVKMVEASDNIYEASQECRIIIEEKILGLKKSEEQSVIKIKGGGEEEIGMLEDCVRVLRSHGEEKRAKNIKRFMINKFLIQK